MYPSQRYSVVLCAHQEIGNYRVRALSSAGVGAYNFENGAPNVEPTTSQSSSVVYVPLREADLHPLENPGAPGEPHPGGADVVLNLALGFTTTPPTFYLNNHAFDVVKTSDSDSFNPVRNATFVAFENQTTIRFVPDNPGPCHIDLHLAVGLAVVLAEDTRDTKQDDPVPADWKSLCPIYEALTPAQLP
ncbi:hypothetical protein BT96DRAFT_1027474 [Gymnopus androsaceus JB14]|uniref:Plastocyanin-like domain-containing protein n=1 Tax=Gymnopus androsaceus JB14 TaxID=1447944 RepID=A0A6A4GBK9_9AGAR|nr:hypothetical protein BT96DRAFT_1027474 [Gymnopus androsaceus JB14]